MSLGLCSACRRHARGGSCPFCGASVESIARPSLGRVSRAGMAAVTAVAIACGGTTTGGDGGADAAEEEALPMPAYGLPADAGPFPVDAGTDARDARPNDDSGITPAYGAPPFGGPPVPGGG